MSSTALYKAFIEVGASEDSATRAAEDVIQVSQLPQLATKADLMATEAGLKSEIGTLRNEVGTVRSEIAILRSDMTAAMANQETRLIKWMVGSLFVFAGIIIASVGILFQTLLSPGVVQ